MPMLMHYLGCQGVIKTQQQKKSKYSRIQRLELHQFLKCQLRTRFTRLKTSLERAVEEKQNAQKTYHDKMAVKLWHLLLGDPVHVRNFHGEKER